MFFVTRLLTVPVKGTKIHEPTAVHLTLQGVVGDRAFYLIDDRGRAVNGRQVGELATVESWYDAEANRLGLLLPDGTVVEDEPRLTGGVVVTDFMSHDVKGTVVEGPFGQALTDFAGKSLRLVAAHEVGAGSDRHPVTLASSASLEFLRTRRPEAHDVDHRRFRTLIEIGGCRPHEEDTWSGRRLQVGQAILDVLEPVPRCSVIRQDPNTGKRSFDALKELFAYRKGRDASAYGPPIQQPSSEHQILFGIYGVVRDAGDVWIGAEVVLLEDGL
jgi:uncharacterized protein YcbX